MRPRYSELLAAFVLLVDFARSEKLATQVLRKGITEKNTNNGVRDNAEEMDRELAIDFQTLNFWDSFIISSQTSMAPAPAPSQAPRTAPTPAPITAPIPAPIPPSSAPTPGPTDPMTIPPSPAPQPGITSSPTINPTPSPSASPTTSRAPTEAPVPGVTPAPSSDPTPSPSAAPTTPAPTTTAPTQAPTTSAPTNAPVPDATPVPTSDPTPSPTRLATSAPSKSPTSSPTPNPTPSPTLFPTPSPTRTPTRTPTRVPTPSPTEPQAPFVQRRLLPFVLQGGAEFVDLESYQSKALARTEEQLGIEGMSDAKIVQYYALYCIYNATNKVPNLITNADSRFDNIQNFPEWNIATGWEENDVDPCSGWHGILCENNQVTTVDLFENVLTGNFPPEVSLLASDGERSTGAGNLFRLDLFANEFLFNNFDNSWITFLGSGFERLYIQATGFAGDLPRLPINLFEMDCSFTLLSGGLTDENFDGLDELNWLLLDGNAYNSSVPSVFGRLRNLEFLYISDAFISGDLSYMEGMPKIVEHWIDVNPGLSGPVFPFIGDLDTLESFSVTQNGITGELPKELGDLENMVQMWFYGNLLTGQIPKELGDLRQMSILQLEGNAFTGTMPTEVCANIGFLLKLEILGADCDDANFDCSCCTCCSIAACNPGLFK